MVRAYPDFQLADFSLPGVPNAFGLWPSPCTFTLLSLSSLLTFRIPGPSDNFPAAGKRPLSSTSPTIMEHPSGDVYLALGGSGGSRIFGSVMQVIFHHLERGLDISQAIEEPRVHNQLYPMETSVETTFWDEGLQGLRNRGHNITSAYSTVSSVCVIFIHRLT